MHVRHQRPLRLTLKASCTSFSIVATCRQLGITVLDNLSPLLAAALDLKIFWTLCCQLNEKEERLLKVCQQVHFGPLPVLVITLQTTASTSVPCWPMYTAVI